VTARRLKTFKDAPTPYVETPQCSHNVSVQNSREARWRRDRYGLNDDNLFRCTRPSVVEIQGKPYCRLHGGHVALDMLLAGKLIEISDD